MKKIILFCVSVFMLAVCGKVSAQEYLLNNTNHNKTKNTCSGYLYDNSKNGNYEANQDRWITICPPASTGNTGRISLTFEEFDIHPTDTVFIYQGTSINDPYMTTSDNVPFFQNNDLLGRTIMPSLMMPSGCLTVRLASDGSNEASGFKAKIECASLCQYPEAALDEMFYRVAADGTLIPRPVRDGADTSINEDGSLNIVRYKSVDFCFGDSVVLVAKPLFPENDNVYHQDASTCIYEWSFGDGQTATVNYNTQVGHRWEDLSGYDLMLVVEDTANGGCRSRNVIDTRVRMATNPIKTVQQMPDMCSGTEVGFTVGYGENSQIIVDSLDFRRGAKERYENTVFIPDGPNCYNLSPTGCYDAPVTFDQFPSGSTVGSGSDVMSVCINMEHTFLGDLGFTLVCPNGQSVILKYNTHSGGSDLGLATSSTSCSNQCDSNCNPPGVGWTYCFSNQYLTNARGVINGNMSSPIDSTNTVDTTGYFQTPVQNATSMATGWETVDLNGFQSLVGCPLNGEWSVRICDDWGADNGYVRPRSIFCTFFNFCHLLRECLIRCCDFAVLVMRSHTATDGQNTLSGYHALNVLGRGLQTDQTDLLPPGGPRLGVLGGEHDLAASGAGGGGQSGGDGGGCL